MDPFEKTENKKTETKRLNKKNSVPSGPSGGTSKFDKNIDIFYLFMFLHFFGLFYIEYPIENVPN